MKKTFLLSLILLFQVSIFAAHTPLSDEPLMYEFKKGFLSSVTKNVVKQGLKLSKKGKDEEEIYEDTPRKKELLVDLRNPSYRNGILVTHEGGVIQNEDIRIQAETIQYINKTEDGKVIHKIEAEKNLMVQYKNRIYVGEELEYDFIKGTGTIYNGKTYAAPWYIGGDVIHLKSDGSYKVKNVYITTCENNNAAWDIHAHRVKVIKRDLLSASHVRFRLFKIPAFWLPSFNINLKKFFAAPIFRYKVNWDKASGVRGSIRYQLYSWRDFAFFGRLDYRVKLGWGGAIETEYYPDHERIKFETKNYLASDIIPNVPKKKHRYRVQGLYTYESESKKTTADITWDKYSDINMPNDFKTDDFEIDTAKRTEMFLRHEEKNILSLLHSRVRVNTFDTIKQDLPTLFLTSRPLVIPRAKVFFQNDIKLSYLDYAYSHDLALHLPDLHGWRCEIAPTFYRPIHFGKIYLNPFLQAKGIFYGHTPQEKPIFLGTLHYQCIAFTKLIKNFKRYTHTILPYFGVEGWARPTKSIDEHFIYSIEDGFRQINMVKLGVKNQLYSLRKKRAIPSFVADLYANAFLPDYEIKNVIPKMYLDLEWNLLNAFIHSRNAYNFARERIDYSNLRLGVTISEDAAFAFEFRHRSRFDWRKANHENFIVDVARDDEALADSPLSDRRNTFLTHVFFRLTPFWSCHFETHNGWNRSGEPPYTEFKIDLYTTVSTSWRIKLSYQHTQRGDRVSADYYLLKI